MLAILFAAQIALSPCKPPGAAEELRCGKVTVFENRAARSGRTIDLNVVVLPALDPAGKREPLFELTGGPGLAGTGSAGLYSGDLRFYRAHRDVVLVDQRGTGASNPLQCVDERSALASSTGEMYPLDYVRRCRDALSKRADLRFYTTPIAMDDLDDVRAALGYDKIDLLGLSYGTRAAMVYARQHPEHVHRIVLTGVVPVWATMPLYHAANAQRAFDIFLDDAAGDFPGLRGRVRELFARLRSQPAQVTYNGQTATLTAPILAEQIRNLLYIPLTSRALPKLLDAAARGDFAPLLKAIVHEHPPIADGMYLSVTCAEDTARIDPQEAKRVTAGTILGDYRIAQQRRACAEWPRGALPANYWDDVRVDAPVLLLAGYRDPVTTPVWADAVAQALPHARVVLTPQGAHLPVGLSHLECWDDKLILPFLDGAELDQLDAACVESMLPEPFAKR
jgi:pimeloyl-ACP methyl ester carboxylesterase